MNKEELQNNYIEMLILDLEKHSFDYWESTQDEMVEALRKLQQENKQLKDNWNKLKEIVKSQSDFKLKARFKEVWFEVDELLSKMEELEKGVNND